MDHSIMLKIIYWKYWQIQTTAQNVLEWLNTNQNYQN